MHNCGNGISRARLFRQMRDGPFPLRGPRGFFNVAPWQQLNRDRSTSKSGRGEGGGGDLRGGGKDPGKKHTDS
jgi:hypothetical protein